MDKCKEAIMAKCGGLGDICAAGEASSNFRESLIGSVGVVIELLAQRFSKCKLQDVLFKQTISIASCLPFWVSTLLLIWSSWQRRGSRSVQIGRHSATRTFIYLYILWCSSNARLLNAASLQKWVRLCFSKSLWRSSHCQSWTRRDLVALPHFMHVGNPAIDSSFIPSIANVGSQAIGDSQAYTAAQAWDFIICGVCSKPRVIYSNRIIEASKQELCDFKTECYFTCTSTRIDINSALTYHSSFVFEGEATISVRPLSCAYPVEWQLLASKFIKISPWCAWCGWGPGRWWKWLRVSREMPKHGRAANMPRCNGPGPMHCIGICAT